MPWIITIVSSAALLTLGGPGMARALEPGDDMAASPSDPEAKRRHSELMARLDALMRERKLYRDPDLTLNRRAARLSVLAKSLSAAINREAGKHVSRYINAFRIAHAQDLLRSGNTVTDATLACGFNTTLNFNREFPRIAGKGPSIRITTEKPA